MYLSLYIDTYHWPVLESEPPSMSFQSIQGFCLTLVWKDKDGEMDIDLLNPDAKEEKAGKL